MKKLLVFLPLVFYLRLASGFFQQDEWMSYAWYILHKNSLGYIWAPSVTHYNPLTTLTNHLLFSLWNMDYQSFLAVSLILHSLVLVLIFLLAREIFRRSWPAVTTALLFGLLAAHYQATAWVVVDISTHFATIFGLLAVIFFLRWRIGLSLSLLIISLLFKEIAIGLFPLFLFYIFLFAQKDRFYSRNVRVVIGVGIIYVLVRVIMLFGPNITGSQAIMQPQSFSKLVYNFVTIPIKAISQSIIPVDILRGLSDFVARFFPEKVSGKLGSPAFEVFVVKRVLEVISLLASAVIALGVLAKSKKSKVVVLGLFWIIANSFVFAFTPERTGIISVIDSRNLYFISIGAALTLVAAADRLFKSDLRKTVLVLLIVAVPNLYFLNKSLADFTQRGGVRKSILTNVQLKYPDLPEKVVIFTQSDQSYYGLPAEETILPFQSGFGQTLLAWYYPTEKFPKEFFANRFLWEIIDQGYREVGERGFGYFRDPDLLEETIKQYNLPQESVIAFVWDGKKNFINDITEEVRSEIYDQKN